MTNKLVWNNDRCAYQAPDDENHTLYVDGDDFSESVRDRARELFAAKHPEMSEDEVIESLSDATEEGDTCVDQATEENLDPFLWSEWAVPMDKEGNRTDGQSYHISAWIEEN